MTGRSTGRICVAALVFAACSMGAASAAEPEFRHGHMVVLDQKGLVNHLLPLGISLTGNSGSEIVVLEGLVEGTQLSVGVNLNSNRWALHAEDVDKAFVGAPHDFSGTMEVTAKLYSASNEPLQSEVVRLEWARGEGAITSGNPVQSRADVDPASGIKAPDAAPLAPASQASPPPKSAPAPIVAANPFPSARAAPAVAGGAGGHRCCGWFPKWFPHWIPGLHYPEPAYPAYYAGPLSGATYEFYYGSDWGRPYARRSERPNRGHYE